MDFIVTFCPGSSLPSVIWLLSVVVIVLLLLLISIILLVQERKSVVETMKQAQACQAQQQAALQRQGLETRQEQKRLAQAWQRIWQQNQEIEYLLAEIRQQREAAQTRLPGRKFQAQQKESRLLLEQEVEILYQAFEEHLASRAYSLCSVSFEAVPSSRVDGPFPLTETILPIDYQIPTMEVCA